VLLDPSAEQLAVDRAIDRQRRDESFRAQGPEKCRGLPAAAGSLF
jgi:hypothetical protein